MKDLEKIRQEAYSQKGLHYRNPKIPHEFFIPGNLDVGRKISVAGSVLKNCKSFTLDLQNGTGGDVDIFFHFEVRLEEKAVVRKYREKLKWGPEDRTGAMPFATSKPFLAVVSASAGSLEVKVNGNSFTTFKLRDSMRVSDITHLKIFGDVIINGVHFSPVTFPKSLSLRIPENLNAGDVFSLRGKVRSDAKNFIVSLKTDPEKGDDVLFYFNPCFENEQQVERNSRFDNRWGDKERSGGMPFSRGNAFNLIITTDKDAFRTWVNEKEFVTFKHREDLRHATFLSVEGDADFENIFIDSIATRLPSESGDDTIRNFHKAEIQLFNPAIPVTHRIPTEMALGRLVSVSGIVSQNPFRFSVNLQRDAENDNYTIYHYNPRFDDNLIVQNTKVGGKWIIEEIRNPGTSPFVPGGLFDLQILCTPSGGYYVAVNGITSVSYYPSRMKCTEARYLNIEGTVQIQRAFLL